MNNKRVFEKNEDFNQKEMGEIYLIVESLEKMDSSERRVLLKGVSIYLDTKNGY
jgi:hypothetical protein